MKFTIELPPQYRREEILRFHGRDPEGFAERVEENRIWKGVTLAGIPAVIELKLEKDRAAASVHADGPIVPDIVEQIGRSLLGLSLDPAMFERAVRGDAIFGKIVGRQKGLRFPQTATVFEALTWAIMGQQVNVAFAQTLRRVFIELAGSRHSSGLWCYPDAAAAVKLTAAALGHRQFSRAKAETILRVAHMTHAGELELEAWRHHPDASHIEQRLLAIKGVGPWTAHYTMLRGIGCPDCSLHGDAAIRLALGQLHGKKEKVDIDHARRLLEPYKPWRSLAAAHLWASRRLLAQ